jgi:hypothetical protein
MYFLVQIDEARRADQRRRAAPESTETARKLRFERESEGWLKL